eukprot:864927-Prorocentrum_minimum.AAC.1
MCLLVSSNPPDEEVRLSLFKSLEQVQTYPLANPLKHLQLRPMRVALTHTGAAAISRSGAYPAPFPVTVHTWAPNLPDGQ